MKSYFSVLVCSVVFTSGPVFAQQRGYQDAASKCEQDIKAAVSRLSEKYVVELRNLMDTFRLKGNLENTLVVKKELDRFLGESYLEQKHLVQSPEELRDLQAKYLAAPKKVSEDTAKSYIISLAETKRTLTIDNKLDEAIVAQKEIEKIQKKYGVADPTKGRELTKEELPKFITMTEDITIPLIVDGQQVGETSLGKGRTYKLVKIDGSQVSVRAGNSDIAVPVTSTDLLNRIERHETGNSDE